MTKEAQTLAEEISRDTGLPLSDVLSGDFDLEMLMWDYPGIGMDEEEEGTDMDDVGAWLVNYESEEPPEWDWFEILNDGCFDEPEQVFMSAEDRRTA